MSRHNIRVERRKEQKERPDDGKLGFGKHFTDHMFRMDYADGKGWHDPRIVPYQPISLEPSAMVFHYGQAVFEGMKAYRSKGGAIHLFRPERNFARFNVSSERMCIPRLDEAFALEALTKLIGIDKDWTPSAENTALYIRPFVIATEAAIGVHPSLQYIFMIILSPVGPYYAEGLAPVTIFVEDEYVRAVRGGSGFAKASANYAISMKSQEKAIKKGVAQVLWLDGVERKYVEEVGTMNVFFKINGSVVTPRLSDSILPGVTRASVIELLKSWDVEVAERRISLEEVKKAAEDGTLEEAFGTGTASVIAPIRKFISGSDEMVVGDGKNYPMAGKLYDTITGIQYGRIEDNFGWVRKI